MSRIRRIGWAIILCALLLLVPLNFAENIVELWKDTKAECPQYEYYYEDIYTDNTDMVI